MSLLHACLTSGLQPHFVDGVRGKPGDCGRISPRDTIEVNIGEVLGGTVDVEVVVPIALPAEVGGGAGHIRGNQMVGLLALYGRGKEHVIARTRLRTVPVDERVGRVVDGEVESIDLRAAVGVFVVVGVVAAFGVGLVVPGVGFAGGGGELVGGSVVDGQVECIDLR